jgi:hypothetical protein
MRPILAVVVIGMIVGAVLFATSAHNNDRSGISTRGPINDYEQGFSTVTLKYHRGSTLLVSTGLLENQSSQRITFREISTIWRPGCAVRPVGSAMYNGFRDGTGWIAAAGTGAAAAGLLHRYSIDGLSIRAHWGGGWFAGFEIKIPRFCTAITKGFVVTFELDRVVGRQLLLQQTSFIPTK